MKLIQLLTFILSGLAIFGCQSNEDRSDAYGNFESTATTISAETGGKILFLNVDEGVTVQAGKLVALIDTTSLYLQKEQIRATIQTLPKKLRNALDDIEVLREQKANVIRERDRVARLVNRKAATPKQLDDLNGEIDVIDKQIEALKTQTQTANTGILAEKGPLIAQMEIVNENIRRSRIYNPIEGTVLTKIAETHEVTAPGAPLYRIAPLDTMTFKFYVDAVQLQSMALGDSLNVLVDSGEESYEEHRGSISWIASEAEFTPRTIQTKKDRVNLVYAVKARVPNPDGRLKIGMPGEVNFNTN